jgi:H+/Cl- antiporter ClcA
MTPENKNKLIIIGTSTIIGFVGDITMYSLAESKGRPFKIHMPQGKTLLQVILIGALTGVVIDLVMNRVVGSLKKEEERELDSLVKNEKKKIYMGQIQGLKPQQVIWV